MPTPVEQAGRHLPSNLADLLPRQVRACTATEVFAAAQVVGQGKADVDVPAAFQPPCAVGQRQLKRGESEQILAEAEARFTH